MTEAERKSLAAVFSTKFTSAARHDIVHDHEAADSVTLLLKGNACAYMCSADGRRQILDVFVPGDLCDLSRLFGQPPPFSVQSLGPCTVARAGVGALREVLDAHPALAMALLRESVVDASVLGGRLASVRRSSAQARTAYLLCELFVRSGEAGLVHGNACALPMTQMDIGDAVGLSVVQTNRVLQLFRRTGMLSLERGKLKIHDLPALAKVGGFSTAHLFPAPGQHHTTSSAA